jgi:serine/threonine protein kinase
MNCPTCKTANDPNAEVCSACGHPLSISLGSLLAGRYEIQGVLGEGGMGTVYKAHDRVLDESVALKVLRPSFARTPEADRRFRSEIKLARKVTHRNVCRIHEYGEDGNLRYLSMEFVDGANLKQVVRGKGGLPVEEARELTIQIAKGLQAIHDVGIIHRDLKTANIMRDAHGVVRLMDFGIAKKWEEEAGEGLTGVGDIIGTPEYMSPEQARGQKLDFRSDIYALGVVLFELLTGELPLKGETPLDTLLKHVQEPPPIEGRIPDVIAPVVRKALAKDPRERYASARGLVADLRASAGLAVPAVPGLPDSALGFGMDEFTPLPGPGYHQLEDSEILAIRPIPPPLPVTAPAPPPASPRPATGPGEAASPDVAERVLKLAAQLKDPDSKARWRAALALFPIGGAAAAAAPALAEAAQDDEITVAEAASAAYRRITGQEPPPRKPREAPPAPARPKPAPVPAAVPPAPAAVAPVPPAAAAAPATAPPAPARATPPPANVLDPLLASLQSGDSFTRWRGVLALGALGTAAAAAVPALVDVLDDQDDNVRWTAATTLGKIGPAAGDAVPALAAALADRGDPVIHKHAAAALAAIGSAARDAVPGLIGALRDADADVREEVRKALSSIGPAAVPALIEALKDEDEQVRFEAADALTKIGTVSRR